MIDKVKFYEGMTAPKKKAVQTMFAIAARKLQTVLDTMTIGLYDDSAFARGRREGFAQVVYALRELSGIPWSKKP